MAHCRLLQRAVSSAPPLPFLTPRLCLPARPPVPPATTSPLQLLAQQQRFASTTRPPKIGRAEKPPKPPAPRRIRKHGAPPLPPKGNKAIALQSPSLPQTLPIKASVPTTELHPSVREHLTSILLQPPYYVTIHIHGFPYLVTVGDTITLPSLLYHPRNISEQSVLCKAGEILRLTHATTIGSRDFTIKGDPYVDGRLFTCRARVVEITGEPMRFKEKTKRRQRRVKTVKSKHRYTVLRICELEVKKPEVAEATGTVLKSVDADGKVEVDLEVQGGVEAEQRVSA